MKDTASAPMEESEIEDRRKSVRERINGNGISFADRRKSPRMRTIKGAQIVWPTGAAFHCVVKNISEAGAKIEVCDPVPGTFVLILDDQSRRSCRVVWRKEIQIGVQFI